MSKRTPPAIVGEQMALDVSPAPLACIAPTPKYPAGTTGTVRGSRLHYLAGESSCEPCRVANREYKVQRRKLRGGVDSPVCEIATKKYPSGRTGTAAGYQAHRDIGQPACPACTTAQTAKTLARIKSLPPDKLARYRKANAEATRRRAERAPDVVRENKHRHMAKNLEIIRSAKDQPCHDCGVRYPYYVMQFDHRVRSQKSFNVGARGPTLGEDRLRVEIAKCDIVCANCHAERTHRQNQRLGRIRHVETATQAGDAA